jgi:hypothetical protein
MDYRTLVSEENDVPEGQDQTLSPFIQFDTQEDQNNSEKRMIKKKIFHSKRLSFLLKESRWSHQKDLDDFFVRVYQYHQRHGFFCIVLSEFFGLV